MLIGSFNSSNKRIELELLNIIQCSGLLDELSANAEGHLKACLQFIEHKTLNGSLAIHNVNDCHEFLPMSVNIIEKLGTGSESFTRELLGPKIEC